MCKRLQLLEIILYFFIFMTQMKGLIIIPHRGTMCIRFHRDSMHFLHYTLAFITKPKLVPIGACEFQQLFLGDKSDYQEEEKGRITTLISKGGWSE